MATDNSDDINTNAQQPKQASGDSGSMSQHSIPDQMLINNNRLSTAAADGKKKGVRFAKFRGQGSP